MDQRTHSSDQPSPVEAAIARIGTPLNARWRLDELLGAGSVGAVFAATHRDGARAAVKILHAQLARDAEARELFLREGKVGDAVEHPARVQVLGEETSDRGEPCLVMELLGGITLERLLARAGGRLPLDKALPIFDTVLDLLDRCHAVGIVHRALDPSNVFLTGAGQVKVLALGAARPGELWRDGPRSAAECGTPAFSAPEVARGVEGIDGRADLFSVGACLYTCLTGRRLHHARTEAEARHLAATQPAPSIAHDALDLPPDLVALVDQALAFQKERRFQSAAAMRTVLRALLARQGVAPPSSSQRARTAEEARKRMSAVLWHFGQALAGVHQFGWSHPHAARGLQVALEEITRALAADPAGVAWDVRPSAFTCEGQAIWQPDRPPFDTLAQRLFADGIRRIQLRPGITEVEVRGLAAVLLRDPISGMGEDDDAVTALWTLHLEHVTYVAGDPIAEGDGEARATFERQRSELARSVRREAGVGVLAAGGAPRQVADAAAAMALDALTRATLAAQVALPPEQWSERYVDALAEAWLDAEAQGDAVLLASVLQAWAVDQIALRNHALAFEMQDALRRAFAARLEAPRAPPRATASLAALDRAIAAAMFPPDALRSILADLTTYGPDEPSSDAKTHPAALGRAGPTEAPPSVRARPSTQAPPSASGAPGPDNPAARKKTLPPIDPAVLQGITHTLDTLEDGSLFGAACGCFGAIRSERLRDVLLAYMIRWSAGREAELAQMLPNAPRTLGLAIVRVLAQRKTPEALAALEAGLVNPHVDVRLGALAELPDAAVPGSPPEAPDSRPAVERMRDELQRLLDDPDSAVRREALRTIGKLGIVAAGPAMVRRIVAPAFHEMPAAERRQWLETLARLSPARAERLAIDLLEKRPLIPSDAVEQTREIAAQFLSLARSQEALRAVKDATKARWWNTSPVRDAAARAVVAIAARIARIEATGDPDAGARRSSAPPPPATARSSSVPPPSALRPGPPSTSGALRSGPPSTSGALRPGPQRKP